MSRRNPMGVSKKTLMVGGGGLAVGWLIGWYFGKKSVVIPVLTTTTTTTPATNTAPATSTTSATTSHPAGQPVAEIFSTYSPYWWHSDAGIAQFLLRNGLTCSSWAATPLYADSAMILTRSTILTNDIQRPAQGYMTVALEHIDAYCAGRINRPSMPRQVGTRMPR